MAFEVKRLFLYIIYLPNSIHYFPE